MSKAMLYQNLKKDWHHWDDEVYRLASSVSGAFQEVLASPEADPSLVSELTEMHIQMGHYKAWRDAEKKKASA